MNPINTQNNNQQKKLTPQAINSALIKCIKNE